MDVKADQPRPQTVRIPGPGFYHLLKIEITHDNTSSLATLKGIDRHSLEVFHRAYSPPKSIRSVALDVHLRVYLLGLLVCRSKNEVNCRPDEEVSFR